MNTEHPITPPPELVEQWLEMWPQDALDVAARWGADQELEACCEEMKSIPSPLGIPFGEMASNALRTARRPKPPSLKERALEALETEGNGLSVTAASVIRRALEALPDD